MFADDLTTRLVIPALRLPSRRAGCPRRSPLLLALLVSASVCAGFKRSRSPNHMANLPASRRKS